MSIAHKMLMAAAGAGGGSGWVADLTNASYDNVALAIFGESVCTAIFFSQDGTKLYYIGYVGDRVRSYSLSVGFDLTTAVSDGTLFSVASQENQPRGLALSTDLSKMFVVGQSNDTVYQYSLSTPGDITTASYDSVSFSVAAQDTFPEAVLFSSDGTKMYIVGTATDTIYQYSLTNPFDLSGASYDGTSFSVADQDTSPKGLAFSSDEMKMYLVGDASDAVFQYSLSVAGDIATASYDNVSFSVADQDTLPTGIAFNTDGSKMYVAGPFTDFIYQYSTV